MGSDLKQRTWEFALRCLKLAQALPIHYLGNHIKGQLIRSSTSTAANYRASQLAQSKAAFIAKLSIALEEADESALWMEFVIEEKLVETSKVEPLLNEANELVKIMAQSRITAQKDL